MVTGSNGVWMMNVAAPCVEGQKKKKKNYLKKEKVVKVKILYLNCIIFKLQFLAI